jgi:hypothetical protein
MKFRFEISKLATEAKQKQVYDYARKGLGFIKEFEVLIPTF